MCSTQDHGPITRYYKETLVELIPVLRELRAEKTALVQLSNILRFTDARGTASSTAFRMRLQPLSHSSTPLRLLRMPRESSAGMKKPSPGTRATPWERNQYATSTPVSKHWDWRSISTSMPRKPLKEQHKRCALRLQQQTHCW